MLLCQSTSAPIMIRCSDFTNGTRNLRVLGITEIKTVPYVPQSHPFIERLIDTIRHDCLDQVFFWTTTDLEMKLTEFKDYYNGYRTHSALDGRTPVEPAKSRCADLESYCCQKTLSWAVSDAACCLSKNSSGTGKLR